MIPSAPTAQTTSIPDLISPQPASQVRTTRRARPKAPRRTAFFLHEPLVTPSSIALLRAGVIADGTTRGGPNGIAEGARRVVELAEHCARRGDIDTLAVLILSPNNLRRRKHLFFSALHAEFLRLLEAVTSGRALAGIRVSAFGRRDRLRKKGGAAAALADILDLLEEATGALSAPRMRLVLCLDYPADTPSALGLHFLIRTGMEEPGVLRLSGLVARPETVCAASTKLFRTFTPADLDALLLDAPRASQSELVSGYSCSFVGELAAELSLSPPPSPVEITVPVHAPRAEMASLVDRWALMPQAQLACVALALAPSSGRPARRAGQRDAPALLRLVLAGESASAGATRPVAFLAPGQAPQAFRLGAHHAGDANIVACAPDPRGVVSGLCHALRFHEAHPPLHGAPRPLAGTRSSDPGLLRDIVAKVRAEPSRSVEAIARELGLGQSPSPMAYGQVFAVRAWLDACVSGLVSGEVDWQRQGIGYGLTAYAILGPHGHEHAPSASEWEPRALALAQVMMALAASDEEITDRVFEGEGASERKARLEVSTRYLVAVLSGQKVPPPWVSGARTLAAIATSWQRFFDEHVKNAPEALAKAIFQSAAALYRANLEELHVGPGRARKEQTGNDGASLRERLHDRLSRTAPSIGAGCALLATAALLPCEHRQSEMVVALVSLARKVDAYFRLANDLAFTELVHGDRDRKPSLLSCLVPARLQGKAKERARLAALSTCLSEAHNLWSQVESGIASLWKHWPEVALCWQRGVLFGKRVYEAGHYERWRPADAADWLAEAANVGRARG